VRREYRFENTTALVGGDLRSIAHLVVEHGNIAELDARSSDGELTGSGVTLVPGFIDIHNHGAVGHDVNDSTAEELLQVSAFLAAQGVTAWLPTLVPDSDENYARAIGEIDRLMQLQEGRPVAQAVGVHYEGAFAVEKMCGALRPQYFKSGEWYLDGGRLPMLPSGVHMITVAPEVENGIDLIERLASDGWLVSIGHTAADVDTLDRALNAGARHMTHFFNAMTGVHHRDLGVAGWGLSRNEVTFDIIADGVHVRPEMLTLACRAKGPDKVTLISDSVAPTGLADGEYQIWGETVSVQSGRTANERGSIAGSVATMLDCVNTMLSIGFSLADVSAMSSTNSARLLGLSDRGSLDDGQAADIVALGPDGAPKMVLVKGQVIELLR
jgi:N-acetylglucosamine-6-phosphate deacetylase